MTTRWWRSWTPAGSPTDTPEAALPDLQDPFGTARLRHRVLAGWAASPERFREDANAEEELATGGYRDAVVVELAQNAADAARAAGGQTRLLLRLCPDGLLAANTGRALDAAGVAALASLRASAKRDATASTGRFGVGFAAVLALSDAPVVGSRGAPGVAFSAARTRDAVAAQESLRAELARRGGQVPVLRLAWPAPPVEVPDGYDTAVWLPWRSGDPAAAQAGAEALLEAIDPTLPLTVPGLAELRVQRPGRPPRVLRAEPVPGGLRCAGVTWLVEDDEGELPSNLLADRPVEERARTRWHIRAAVRADGAGLPEGAARTLRAPQPTREPLSLPVLLSVPVPLDPERQHARPGRLTDYLLGRCGAVLARLAARLADPLPLVPTGLAAGAVDAAVRTAALAALATAAVLPTASPGRVRPGEAVCVDTGAATEATVELLAGAVAGLLPAGWAAPGRAGALAALGVRRWGAAEVVELLRGWQRPPAFWHRVYEALARVEDLDALAALPVPLADGRVVTGARGAYLADGPVPELAELARLVHPEAAHPLLARLGARRAGPRELLEELRAAVAGSCEEPDPSVRDRLAATVLGLVERAGLAVGELPWLAELALPGPGGQAWPAGDLVLAGGRLDGVVDVSGPLGLLDPDAARRLAPAALRAVGVLDTFAIVRATGVDLTAPPAVDLDGGEEYLRAVAAGHREEDGPPILVELAGVADLDLVVDWRRAWALLAGQPELRAAMLTPARCGRRAVPSYTAWWLSTHPVLDGACPGELRLREAGDLAGVYDPAPGWADPALLRAAGCRGCLDDVLADPGGVADLLDRLGDADRRPGRGQVRRLYALAALAADGAGIDPPYTVRAVRAGRLTVVPTGQAVVVDAPDLFALLDRPWVPVPLAQAPVLARVLAVPLASAVVTAGPDAAGEEVPLPAPPGWIRDTLAGQGSAWPAAWRRHDRLSVAGREVDWRVHQGVVHATGPSGLARGLALLCGQWGRRHAWAEWLSASPGAGVLAAEADCDDGPPR